MNNHDNTIAVGPGHSLSMQGMDRLQPAGLIHAFFAESEVLKSPETQSAKARQLDLVGVVGGGTMGAGIAVSMLDAGLNVIMIERIWRQ